MTLRLPVAQASKIRRFFEARTANRNGYPACADTVRASLWGSLQRLPWRVLTKRPEQSPISRRPWATTFVTMVGTARMDASPRSGGMGPSLTFEGQPTLAPTEEQPKGLLSHADTATWPSCAQAAHRHSRTAAPHPSRGRW
jgi:hypothetical protein